MKSTCKALLAIIVLVFALTQMGVAQSITIEPDSVDFGAFRIGQEETIVPFQIRNLTPAAMNLGVFTINLERPEDCQIFTMEVTEIFPVLRTIYQAVWDYKMDFNEGPNEIYDLVEGGYLEIEERFLWFWRFRLVGSDPVTLIQARGERMVIEFDLTEASYRVLSLDYEPLEPLSQIELSGRQTKDFCLVYSPRNPGPQRGMLSFQREDERVLLAVRSDVFAGNSMHLSTNEIDFGEVYAGTRVIRALSIRNNSDLVKVLDFMTDNESVSIFDGLVLDVRQELLKIEQAIWKFRSDHNEDPTSMDELIDQQYIEPDTTVARDWHFSFIGQDPITQIEAISMAEFPYGAGHIILMDMQTRNITGFGTSKILDFPFLLNLGPQRSKTVFVELFPKTPGDITSTITMRSSSYERNDGVETYFIELTGSSLGIESGGSSRTESFQIIDVFPNPFNSRLTITLGQGKLTPNRLTIHDLQGRVVAELVSGEGTRQHTTNDLPNASKGGKQSVVWDATGVAAGIYIVRLESAGRVEARKVVLVR